MIPDDESLLSAYMDGQLGPDEQQAVEAALLDDPRLAEELRGLAAVRELLAGLPREFPADLTTLVMRRIRRRAWVAAAWGPAGAAGLVALAAGVLAIVMVPWFQSVRRPDVVHGSQPAVRKPGAGISESRWPQFASHPARERVDQPADAAAQRPAPAQPTGPAPPARDDLVRVREYLDHPQLRHMFLVSDPGDGSNEHRVASVVEQTTRFNFYKITIAQGIVIDQRHPDQATVFALVVAPRDLDTLRDRLRTALNDRVDEQPAEPGIATKLADVGKVEACSPSPVADIEIPKEQALAFRQGIPGIVGQAPVPAPAERADTPPTREQERSSPAAEILEQSRAAPVVVLVWVTRARPG